MKNALRPTKLKAMSLLMAVLTWGIVTQITDNVKTVRNVPLTIDLPPGLSIRDQSVGGVNVTFRGTREDLLLLDERTVQVQVTLDPDTPPGLRRVQILPRQVTHTSPKARITDIEPDTVDLRLGREGQKELSIRVVTTGELQRGLRVESIEYEPKIAVLRGAEELLESVTSLQTSPINLTDRAQNFEQRVDVLPPSPDWVGRVDPPRISVRVSIAGLTEDKSFSGVPVQVYADIRQEFPLAVEADPPTVQVFLRGRPQLLESLRLEQIQAFVPAAAAVDGNTAEVAVLAPPNLMVVGVQPTRIRFRSRPTPIPPTPTPTAVPKPSVQE